MYTKISSKLEKYYTAVCICLPVMLKITISFLEYSMMGHLHQGSDNFSVYNLDGHIWQLKIIKVPIINHEEHHLHQFKKWTHVLCKLICNLIVFSMDRLGTITDYVSKSGYVLLYII